MAKKNESKGQDVPMNTEAKGQDVPDLNELFSMRFRDPVSGEIVMVRHAFKPRGKLEFYCPENHQG